MYLADYHVHSTCSPDGHQTMAQAAEAAVRQGLRELCITDHVDTIQWGTQTPRDDFDWAESRRQFHEAQALWGDRITLRRGAELGEAQLSFDRADRLLAGEELDFVIGSVHLSGKKFDNMDLYYIEKGSEAYYDSVIDSYLDDVLTLARWGRFQVLGHLTLPLRYINEHHGEHMTFRRHMDRVEEIFRTMIPKGLGIECKVGLLQRPERVVITALAAIASGATGNLWWLAGGMLVIAVLANLTACWRIAHCHKVLNAGKKQ